MKIKLLIASLFFVASTSAIASGFADCSQNFMQGKSPSIELAAIANRTTQLCSSGHASLFSAVTRTPLFSASYLSSERLANASQLERIDSFKPDLRLPINIRANLSDYARSGYDRGHLAPNSDMANREEQSDSFLLSNMVPQNADNNRNIWAQIEHATRTMAKEKGGAYVVTGGAYLGNTVKIGSGIYVPTHMWKAVYFPKTNEASAWMTANQDGENYEVISIAVLANRIGIDPFPALDGAIKTNAVTFITPARFRY